MKKNKEPCLLLSALLSLANATLKLLTDKRNTKTKETSSAVQAHFLSSADLSVFLTAFPNTNATINKKS